MAFQTQGQSASLKSPAKPATNSPPATGVLFVPSPPPPPPPPPGDHLFQSFPRHTRRRSSRRFHLFFHVSLPLIHPAKKVAAYFKTWLRDARDCYMRTSSGRLVDIPFHETILPPVTSHSVSAPPTPGASVDNSFHLDDCDDDDRKKLLGDDGGEDSDDVDRTCDRGAADEELGVTCPRGGATCCGRMAGLTPVALMWSLLSILVVGACGVSLFHPYWVMHPDRLHSFGLFTYCMRDMASTLPQAVCHGYGEAGGGRMELTRIPAGAWQASTLLFGGGVALEAVGAVVTVVLLLLPSYGRHRLALLNGYLQTVAVLIMLAGLLMFPLGFSTPFFQYYCESTRVFCVGHCRMGWSYVLAITGTALAIFCPVLSNYTDMTFGKDKERDRSSPTSMSIV